MRAKAKKWRSLSIEQKEEKLRKLATPSELKLRLMLDAHPLTANRYQFQRHIHGYFPDFSFSDCRLIVELDGAVHAGVAARRSDARRSARLRAKGWRVIRFWNGQLSQPEVVMKAILMAIRVD